jgi:phosphoglycerate dehydrogenase-like enzyme
MTDPSAPLNVGLAFRISEDLQAEIAALDPRIRLVDISQLGGRGAIDDATRDEILARIGTVEVIVGSNTIPTEYFEAAANLRWFQAINAGVDNMHGRGLLGRGFQVTTGAGIAAVSIAEHSIGLMIMLARNFHRSVLSQQEGEWKFQCSSQLGGKTLGIVGLGEIGRQTARRARAFEMRVIACRRSVGAGTDPDCDELFAYDDLGALLEQSDYVQLAVPLTPETRHMIGAAEFVRMKPTASLVNVARGEVVDQDALIEALQNGTIASAGLDVVTPEPLPADNPLWSMPNVIITPHTAGAVEGYGHRAIGVFIANLRRYVAGETLSHVVNPALGY